MADTLWRPLPERLGCPAAEGLLKWEGDNTFQNEILGTPLDPGVLLTDLAVGAVKADGTAASVGVAYWYTSSTVETGTRAARVMSTVVDVDACHGVRHQVHHSLVDRQLKPHVQPYIPQSSSGCSATTRGNPYKLCVNHCRINVRKHFSERIIRVWNSLPPSIVSFESLSSFSKSLCNVNLGIHPKY